MAVRISDISKDLHTKVKRFFDTTLEADATPLEICQAVLDDVERQVQPLGRGRRVFPYSRLLVRIKQPAAGPATIDAVFAGFEQRVHERLGELCCDAPMSLEVQVECVDLAPEGWSAERLFAVEYGKGATPIAAPALTLSVLRATVVKGAATEAIYTFTDATISIGRTADPTDDSGRVRRNRIAFLDTIDGVTETVGRAHARLRFDAAARECLIFDEGSSNGTSVVRGGTTIPVPARDPRGVRVKSGDELQVGRAVIKIDIVDSLNGDR